ncbi:hypothetical protein PR048_030006 [Dryococelus australis]|uniref:Uncharacterized protein n=1 Tax=Dryococelus australis TaxID=614101 RepID=A0ABQ9G7Q9_9NEOP|nr:hypothetical protein PR048_030006 [Dryococelus australis]
MLDVSTHSSTFDSRRGSFLISVLGNLAGRCRWSAGFLGDLPFPLPVHSGAAPYSHHFNLSGSRDHEATVTSPLLVLPLPLEISGYATARSECALATADALVTLLKAVHCKWVRGGEGGIVYQDYRALLIDRNCDCLLHNCRCIPSISTRGEAVVMISTGGINWRNQLEWTARNAIRITNSKHFCGVILGSGKISVTYCCAVRVPRITTRAKPEVLPCGTPRHEPGAFPVCPSMALAMCVLSHWRRYTLTTVIAPCLPVSAPPQTSPSLFWCKQQPWDWTAQSGVDKRSVLWFVSADPNLHGVFEYPHALVPTSGHCSKLMSHVPGSSSIRPTWPHADPYCRCYQSPSMLSDAATKYALCSVLFPRCVGWLTLLTYFQGHLFFAKRFQDKAGDQDVCFLAGRAPLRTWPCQVDTRDPGLESDLTIGHRGSVIHIVHHIGCSNHAFLTQANEDSPHLNLEAGGCIWLVRTTTRDTPKVASSSLPDVPTWKLLPTSSAAVVDKTPTLSALRAMPIPCFALANWSPSSFSSKVGFFMLPQHYGDVGAGAKEAGNASSDVLCTTPEEVDDTVIATTSSGVPEDITDAE